MKEYNPFLEANKELNKRIDKLEKELKTTFKYKEMFEASVLRVRGLEKLLEIKRNVVKIVGRTNNDTLYCLMIKDVYDTNEGLYVEVFLPNLTQKEK